jgi:ribonuclease Z
VQPIFQAKLVNGVWGDPVVLIDLKYTRRAILFDIGDVTSLSTRILLRVSDVFVSHTHMDHFAGFDHLLRVCLGRMERGIRLKPASRLNLSRSQISNRSDYDPLALTAACV